MKNSFWVDVLHAWAEFIARYKPEPQQVLTDKLWFSDNTKYTYSIVKKWDKNGLKFIGDLVNTLTGQLYAREELHRAYNVDFTFLCHESLIRSLPLDMRNRNHQKQLMHPIIPYKISLLNKNNSLTRLAYKEFVASLRNKYTDSQEAWKK